MEIAADLILTYYFPILLIVIGILGLTTQEKTAGEKDQPQKTVFMLWGLRIPVMVNSKNTKTVFQVAGGLVILTALVWIIVIAAGLAELDQQSLFHPVGA